MREIRSNLYVDRNKLGLFPINVEKALNIIRSGLKSSYFFNIQRREKICL